MTRPGRIAGRPLRRTIITVAGVCLLPSIAAAAAAAAGGEGEGELTVRMMMLAAQLGVIILVARAGNLLFQKLRLPGVMGELAVGVVIGPHALGGLALPGFPHGLFPLWETFPVSPELFGVSSVAAIVLLFMAGVETRIDLFRRYSLTTALVGIGGVVASFAVVQVVVALGSVILSGGRLGLMSSPVLFLAAIGTATSVGITARILSERRQGDSPEGVTIVSAAVVDDVLGFIVFTVVVGMVAVWQRGEHLSWAHVGWVAAMAVGVWLGAMAVGLLLARRISAALKLVGKPSVMAIIGLGLALVVAALFEHAGLALIIGAYVTGLVLAKTDLKHVVRERLETVYELLVPVFFCVMGMLIDLRAVGSWEALIFGAIYSVAAVAGKMIGCGLPPLATGFNLRGALRIGLGMIPRGEVALIIAAIGLATGVLSKDMFAAAVLMTAATSFLTPPALVLAFRSRKSGLRRGPAAGPGDRASVDYGLPSPQIADFVMAELATVFENEGFFVHRLSPSPPLYQILKDEAVIDFSAEGSQLTFRCAARDLPLVRAAVMEAVAGLERMMRELSRPIDTEALRRDIPQDTAGRPAMGLDRYLPPAMITVKLHGRSVEEIIDELIDLLDRGGLVKDRGQAHRDVLARERSLSTALGGGLAVPHGRTEAVDQFVCAMGIHKQGVQADAPDGQPVRFFLLSLCPKDKPAPQVQFLAAIVQSLTPRVKGRVLQCRNSQEVYRILASR